MQKLRYLELTGATGHTVIHDGVLEVDDLERPSEGAKESNRHLVRVFAPKGTLGFRDAKTDKYMLLLSARDIVAETVQSRTKLGALKKVLPAETTYMIYDAKARSFEPRLLKRHMNRIQSVIQNIIAQQGDNADRLLVEINASTTTLEMLNKELTDKLVRVMSESPGRLFKEAEAPSSSGAAVTDLDRRREMAKDWPDANTVNKLLGSSAGNFRQKPARLRQAGQLLGAWVAGENRYRYPPFQFNREGLAPQIGDLMKILPVDNGSGWGRLQWFYTPHSLLQGKTPAEVFEIDPDRVVLIAKRQYSDSPDAGW